MALAALTDAEVESLRFHLGYGNIDVGAYPSTPDGFRELFAQVIAPNLTSAEETASSTEVAAPGVVSITVDSPTDIVVNARLIVDVGDDAEIVAVKSIVGSVVTARFANTHPASGYPVAIESGVSRLRLLLHSAYRTWTTLQSASITQSAGLKQLGQGEIEWFGAGRVLADTRAHYDAIIAQISSLVRVQAINTGGRVTRLECG